MIKLEKFYVGKDIKKKYEFEYDKKNKKRPSWLKFKDIPENVNFVKITINDETFWYRRYFENYFFPLNSTSVDYENYYDKVAEEYDDIVPHNKEIAKFIIKQLEKYKIKKESIILELGAGTGLVSEEITKNGYTNLTLMDISLRSLEIAKKKKLLSNCKFIKANVLEFKSRTKFKVIYNSTSLDYFNEYELDKILKLTKQNLTKDGLFISVDRHIYKQYDDNFKKIDSGDFFLNTSTGKWKYDYFIGRK